MEEDHLMKERISKLNELKEMGIDPYPYSFEQTRHAKDILDQHKGLAPETHTEDNVSVAGRIMFLRRMGKATFLHLQDETGRIQAYIRQDDVGDAYKVLKKSDIGDIIGIKGHIFATKTGETSVYAKEYTLLSKSIRPLPDKYHGIKDKEIKYRKRYLDLTMDPDVKEIFRKRAVIYKSIREFLDNLGYIEVQTPILQTQYGGANARPFKTKINAWNMPMYMRIAYELHLKRLLVGGFEKVYDLSMCFRNEGVDKTHNPEFAMMEVQTAYEDYNYTMQLAENMWEYIAKKLNGTTVIRFGDKEIDLKAPWERLSMHDAIKKYAGIDIANMPDEDVMGKGKELGLEAENRGLMTQAIFEELVEEKLVQPVHIIDHPVETCPLAKAHREKKGLIERVESFVNGWEVGNYYSELVDPKIQREHFEEQVKKGRGGDEEAHPMDEDYIEALEYGLPPNAGIGIGIDRMVMLMTGCDSIREVLLFPIMKPKE